MRICRIFRLMMLLLLAANFTVAQEPQFVVSSAGTSGIFTPRSDLKRVKIDLVVRVGSVYLPDTLNATAYLAQKVYERKIHAAISSGKYGLSKQNIDFSARTSSERTHFQFFVEGGALVKPTLQLLRDTLFNSTIANNDVTAALDEMRQELLQKQAVPTYLFEQELQQRLYGKDWVKLNIYGNPTDYKYLDQKRLSKFVGKYYSSNNTIVIVTGNFEMNDLTASFEGAFGSLPTPDFDPEMITKVIDFKPMVYRSTMVAPSFDTIVEVNICRTVPGMKNNTQASFSGFLLAAILNDKDNYIQQKARKLGASQLTFKYELYNFSGKLTAVTNANPDSWQEVTSWVDAELQRADQTLVNESMMNMGKLLFRREFTLLTKTVEYPEWVARFWVNDDGGYVPALLDSVLSIDEHDLRNYAVDYLRQNPACIVLKINDDLKSLLKIDSVYPPLDESVFNYVFKYRQNVTNLETMADTQQLNKVIAWLKLNPEATVQVNGFSDEGEFSKVYDDTIMAFIDSMPQYRKTSPDKIQKRYLRPDMMRAMRIVKFMYDNGISASRLRGTGMKFTSSDRAEASDNMKCTIQFDFGKRSPYPEEYYRVRKDY